MIFFLTITINEPEGNSLGIEYSASIPGSDDSGSFNNKLLTRENNLYTATVSYALPGSLPLGVDVTLTIEATDEKGALLTRTMELGPVKPPPVISEVESTGLSSSPISITWSADSDGLYQFYTRTDTTTECIIDLSASVQVFNYYEGEERIVSSNYSGTERQFCVVIFDALDQYDFIEYQYNTGTSTWEKVN
jgi:hypothetical protein